MISYVNISQIQVGDSGLYRCVADNGLAQIAHEAQISVVGPIQVKPMPNITVLSGGTLRVRCPVAGWPVGDIQWLHGGRRLPMNHKQRVYDNGTLVVEHMERSASVGAPTHHHHHQVLAPPHLSGPPASEAGALSDEGEYACVASSAPGPGPKATAFGESASGSQQQQSASSSSGSVWVSIRAKPMIEPFAISRSLREGQRATLMCTISSGDLPIDITWFHNGRPLRSPAMPPGPAGGGQSSAPEVATALDGVRQTRVSDYSSTLLFETLLAGHSGNYTCLARNLAGEVSYSAPMIVQGEYGFETGFIVCNASARPATAVSPVRRRPPGTVGHTLFAGTRSFAWSRCDFANSMWHLDGIITVHGVCVNGAAESQSARPLVGAGRLRLARRTGRAARTTMPLVGSYERARGSLIGAPVTRWLKVSQAPAILAELIQRQSYGSRGLALV